MKRAGSTTIAFRPWTPMTYDRQAFDGRCTCHPTRPSGSPGSGLGTSSSAQAAVPPSRLRTTLPSSASMSRSRSLPLPWAQMTTVSSGISFTRSSICSTASQMGRFLVATGLVPSTCQTANSS